jgi:GH24 family phage-related lysozyme (muramidase)
MAAVVGPNAFEAIVAWEVSSEAYYTARLSRLSWPGGASGLTCGIGYDCGYEDAATISADWGDLLPLMAVRVLQQLSGVKGSAAGKALASYKNAVQIPWAAAMANFRDIVLPRYAAATLKAMPACADLHPESFGSLVSITYNRGAGWNVLDARHAEMVRIRSALIAGDLDAIPGHIRDMKRLWQNADGTPLQGMAGLLTRRDGEADLFEAGLRVA